MKKVFLSVALLLSCCLIIPAALLAHHDQVVAGAGPSTKVAELFFNHFSKNPVCKDYSFAVMSSSIKHKGGILSSQKYLFGRTGRPLNAKEKALGKTEILLGRVPIAFAVGLETDANNLKMTELQKIFTRKVSNWKEVGGNDLPIQLVGREAGEALFSVLQNDYPFFKTVSFDKIFKRDHEVVKYLNSPDGANAISFGAKPNFQLYNLLPVDGFSSGVALGLVYDNKNADHPVIKAAIEYANSAEWKGMLKNLDMLPVD